MIDKNDNDPECIQMILPNDISHPTRFTTFIPEYKENWTTDDGYIISYTIKKGYSTPNTVPKISQILLNPNRDITYVDAPVANNNTL